MGIFGAFLISIVGGGLFNSTKNGSVKPNEVAGYVASLSPMSVPKSKNQSELEPMLKQVVGETFAGRPNRMQVTGLGGNAVPGRRTSVVQLSDAFGSVAVIALLDVKTVDGLYVYEQDPSFHYTTIDGVNSLFWTRGDGVICMVIGQREVSELYEIVQAMCPTKR